MLQAQKRIREGSICAPTWPAVVTIFGWSTKKHLEGKVSWISQDTPENMSRFDVISAFKFNLGYSKD